jgi:hypothetical protein
VLVGCGLRFLLGMAFVAETGMSLLGPDRKTIYHFSL